MKDSTNIVSVQEKNSFEHQLSSILTMTNGLSDEALEEIDSLMKRRTEIADALHSRATRLILGVY